MTLRAGLRLSLNSLLFTGCILTFGSFAQAGFEWVPPKQEKAPEIPKTLHALPPIAVQKDETSMQIKNMQKSQSETMAPVEAPLKPQPLHIQNSPKPATAPYIRKELAMEQKEVMVNKQEETMLMDDETNIDLPTMEPAQQERTSAPMQPIKLQRADRAPVKQSTSRQRTAPSKQATQQPIIAQKTKEKTLSTLISENNAGQTKFAPIYGFGTDMPLALALQQIVPADYSYAFGTGVNPGQKISWQGGERWDQVLSDSLAHASLRAGLRDNTILILKKQTPNAPLPPKKMQSASLSGDMPVQPSMAIAPPTSQTQDKQQLHAMDLRLKTPDDLPAMGSKGSSTGPIALSSYEVSQQRHVKRAAILDPKDPQPMATAPSNSTIKKPSLKKGKINPFPLGESYGRTRIWEARAGESLKTVLQRWSAMNTIQMIWSASHDYTINKDVALKGTMNQALGSLFKNGLPHDQKPSARLMRKKTSGEDRATLIVQDMPAGS